MPLNLTATEARVLGVLFEKEVTTPDAYPLSLNAITAACNQRSNRDPVMSLDEGQVGEALDALIAATVVRRKGPAGGRVDRYAHRLSDRLFGELEFSRAERAVLCVLLLRGAQTPGEIRARSGRLNPFESIPQIEGVLRGLAEREDGPHVRELGRAPGRREARYGHLLCGEPEDVEPAPGPSAHAPPVAAGNPADALVERITALEDEVARLAARLEQLTR